MKRLDGAPFDQWRDKTPEVVRFYGGVGDETCGVFNVTVMPTGRLMRVIASVGAGWDHVSVSTPDCCPTWEEMVFVKRWFFKHNEWAMELHPPESKNINYHPYCLHLWRPRYCKIETPPEWTIA